jgi:hypothetical protein
MLRVIVPLLFLMTLCKFASGQDVAVKIILKNEKNEEVPGATLKVTGKGDSLLARKTLLPGTLISLPARQEYLFSISATSIVPIEKKIQLGTKDTTLLITATANVKSMEGVVVTSRKPLVTQQDDKTIVDAEIMANSSTNAYEVLEKTPGAIVDQDGNVYLNSATPATIQINGREVKLSATDLASLLKSLPANSIAKIEILRTPSAKYDASSSGGIVNIVLKKGMKLGTNGSFNFAYFQGKYATVSAGFNLNKSVKKVNTNLNYQFTDRNYFEEVNSLRYITRDNSIVNQKAYTKYPGQSQFVNGGIDIALNKDWSFGYNTRISHTRSRSNATNDIELLSQANQSLMGKTQSLISNSGPAVFWNNEIELKWTIDSVGSELEIEADYDYSNNKNRQDYRNNFLIPFNRVIAGDGDINNKKNIGELEAGLTLKLKHKYTLEAGAKLATSHSQNSALYFVDSSGGRKTDSFQTNRFRYREQISSAYLQLSKTFVGFTIKPGLRLENTNIEGNQFFPKDTTVQIKRTDLFPYLYLRRNITKLFGFMLTGNAIYRRSIRRPFYEALNPYPRYIDQYLFDVGNPSLRPQFTSNYEFNIMADQFPVFSIGLNDITDIFTNVTYQDDSSKIVYRTYDNLGRNKEMYLRFVGGIPPGGKYFFYLGGQHNLSNYDGFYQGQPLSYKRGSWTFFMFQNYKPTPTLNISMNGFMRVKGLVNFYELKTFGQLNISVNKAILKKKMNIILAGNDIFRTNQYGFNIQQAGIKASGKRFNDTRRIGLTIRYNFGIRPKEEKTESFEAPAEGNSN